MSCFPSDSSTLFLPPFLCFCFIFPFILSVDISKYVYWGISDFSFLTQNWHTVSVALYLAFSFAISWRLPYEHMSFSYHYFWHVGATVYLTHSPPPTIGTWILYSLFCCKNGAMHMSLHIIILGQILGVGSWVMQSCSLLPSFLPLRCCCMTTSRVWDCFSVELEPSQLALCFLPSQLILGLCFRDYNSNFSSGHKPVCAWEFSDNCPKVTWEWAALLRVQTLPLSRELGTLSKPHTHLETGVRSFSGFWESLGHLTYILFQLIPTMLNSYLHIHTKADYKKSIFCF